jgi:hypothetical protein
MSLTGRHRSAIRRVHFDPKLALHFPIDDALAKSDPMDLSFLLSGIDGIT